MRKYGRFEHESVLGHEHSSTSCVDSVGWCHSSSITMEVVGGSCGRSFNHALGNIWFCALPGICGCSCCLACFSHPFHLSLVELCQGWLRVQNIRPYEESEVALLHPHLVWLSLLTSLLICKKMFSFSSCVCFAYHDGPFYFQLMIVKTFACFPAERDRFGSVMECTFQTPPFSVTYHFV